MRRSILISVVAFCVCVGLSYAEDIKESVSENMLFKAELELAKKSDNYLIFDLNGKMIRIKASGLALKEVPLEKVSVWGSPLRIRPLSLMSKSTLFKPKRAKIKPGHDADGKPHELDALEVNDMPVRYRLDLEDGVCIYVRPRPEGIISGTFYFLGRLKSFILRPVILVWHVLRGKTYTAIDIALNETDARSLYWGFPEGSRCIPYFFAD